MVIGARGHLGSRIVQALEQLDGVEIVNPRRHGGRGQSVDLDRPATFAALQEIDITINAASTHHAAPDALARHALQHGHRLLETSSDRRVMQRLLELRHTVRDARGTLLLGAGIFTGLSNLLGASTVAASGACDRLELTVCASPFSGAGAGTVALMLDALRTPACKVIDGEAVELKPIGRGPEFPAGPSLLVSFAEPQMLHASSGVPNVSMYMVPKPAALAATFLATPSWLRNSRSFRALLWLQFTLLRRFLLRGRPTRVELTARAYSRGNGETAMHVLSAADGMWSAGVASASIASLLAGRRQQPGVFCVDECVTLQEVVERMGRIDPGCIELTASGDRLKYGAPQRVQHC